MLAVLHVEDKWQLKKLEEAENVYETTNEEHVRFLIVVLVENVI